MILSFIHKGLVMYLVQGGMMLKNIKSIIAGDSELDIESLRLLSLFFLFMSGIMSFFNYTHIGWIWNTTLTFTPEFISTLIAIFLVAPLYMRGILKWNKSIYTIISFFLILLVFASFIQLALGGNGKNVIIISLLASAFVLSWLGIKAVAGVSWILVFIAGIYSALVNSLAMGFFGFIYVSCGFMGLILHSGMNLGQLVNGIKSEYSPSGNSIAISAKQDLTATVGVIKSHNQ